MPSAENSNYRGQIIRVAVPSPLRRLFDYLPARAGTQNLAQPGVRVLVPFGNRKLVAIVVEIGAGSRLDTTQLKHVIAVLDSAPLFPQSMQRVLSWAAMYYQHPIGEVYGTAMPAKLRAGHVDKITTTVWRARHALDAESSTNLTRAPKQRQLLDYIQSASGVTLAQCEQAGFNSRLLAELHRKELIVAESTAVEPDPAFKPQAFNAGFDIELNPAQRSAVASISNKLDKFSCFLLDGVTGSGKTEVYMRVMQQQLASGKQCLVLVPEIGLTPQTVARFEQRFQCPVVTLHSGLNDSQRLDAWNKARSGVAGIVIGTRSAIFTPMANPGLIVLDEEHDSSFKQQDGFRYSARDLAVIRAREENIAIVLGSATPSLESLHNAQSQKFTHLSLPNRAGAATSSALEIIDIATQPLEEGFSEMLLYKIGKHLKSNNQVLVFINRRGFAPVLSCQGCGWSAECEHCIAQLTVHSKPPCLRCHHCGAAKSLPAHCPQCLSKKLTTFGMGTQKLEKFLQEKFSSVPVLRVDRDSTRNKSSLADLFDKVHAGEPCILLGTQMLAKGHHFPRITLAAILDADVGLFSADFRGQEHMAQTIIQVAGRAGRAQHKGEVLLQSRHADHRVLQCLAQGDYSAFSAMLLQERKQAGMPPFAHLALIRAESTDPRQALDYLKKIREFADTGTNGDKQGQTVALIGPLPAPMEKRAGRFRVQLLLRSSQRGSMQELLSRLCAYMESSKQPAKLRWSVDVDPQDLI